MQPILVAGAGKVGSIIALLLAHSGDYQVTLVDINLDGMYNLPIDHFPDSLKLIELDIHDEQQAQQFLKENPQKALVSALPYHGNLVVAELANQFKIHYFDLTEDTKVSHAIDQLAKGCSQVFAPQCGLAPGLINIAARTLIDEFDHVDVAKLRCGALPQHSSNALNYAITWSIEGLINEYCNPCEVLENGRILEETPLSHLEKLQIDGATYESFNTSGGVGSLISTYAEKVNRMNYKSIRYPGHCEKMRFLMYDLRLDLDRKTLKKILEFAIPITHQDVVIFYVSVQGQKNHELHKKSIVKKFYPKTIHHVECSAMQVCTASSAAAVIDIVLQNPDQYHGRVKQEDFVLQQIFDNRFGGILDES